MGLFSKSNHSRRKNREDADFIIPMYGDGINYDYKLTPTGEKPKVQAPHALTPEEDLGVNAPELSLKGDSNGISPFEALKRKQQEISESVAAEKNKTDEKIAAIRNAVLKDSQTNVESEMPAEAPNTEKIEIPPEKPHFETENIEMHTETEKSEFNAAESITDKKYITESIPKAESAELDADINQSQSLMEKCMPFITENGSMPEEKPAYTLDSVDSIINANGARAAELLNRLNSYENITITADDLSAHQLQPEKESEPEEEPAKENTESFDGGKTTVIGTISDIDFSETQHTIQIDAIKKAAENIDISSGTRVLDLSSELFEDSAEEAEVSQSADFENPEEYIVEDDYQTPEDTQRIGVKLLKNRRSALLRVFSTLILTAALGICSLNGVLAESVAGIVQLLIFAVILIANIDMFSALGGFLTKRYLPECGTAVAGSVTLIYAAVCLAGNTMPGRLLLMASTLVLFKTFAVFMRTNYLVGNFKIIAGKSEKLAIKLIDNRPSTFTMAKNAIEGDALIGTTVNVTNCRDYIKYSTGDSAMLNKFGVFSISALVVSLLLGLAEGFLSKNFGNGATAACTAMVLCFAPTSLFTDILPLWRAAKKLNRKSAMITSTFAAQKIEEANAICLKSEDLFPDGTVTLYNMKELDKNPIDITITKAAAVGIKIGSPLKSILCDIAKNNLAEIPEADSVKYEDRMGISGWVKDSHILIGNRTLLEAHGIKVPSLEVDKKILSHGYFPVYIAADGKPCALLVVKYCVKAKIARQLQKITGTGVTLLVNNCDPNIVSAMVEDYFGLFEGTAFVMDGAGNKIHNDISAFQESASALAAMRKNSTAFIDIFITAAKIKHCVSTLSVMHILSAAILVGIYAYLTLLGGVSVFGTMALPVYLLISIIVSYIASLFNR